ncbi:hypothetical protein SAMN05216412_104109 [Nitrosospira multiformis]|uniref:Uncharacterized protein n=1 Tax=Nitrosospira multiformis TaxID=1231 RepID=A0A1I0CWB3_9PROT|nr:hypothetical protein [Nitrosospira multiformis]SET23599.1 hypothetical protein SAMN05216412_104109 [Nitrosospira multiformis]
MTPDDLIKRHDQQQHEAAQAAMARKLPANPNISDLADFSRDTMAAVIKEFGTIANETGSWIDSLPLPLQLMTQSKLTVDLTLETLKSPAPFGLSLASLCKLARKGFIYLNLRDYDSDLQNGLAGHHACQLRLEQLFTQAPNAVYFGSAIRKSIFDAAITKTPQRTGSGNKTSQPLQYENYHAEAAQTATFWHYAYLRSVEGYLPYQINQQLTEAYGRAAHSVEDMAKFMHLARICHLNFTAPITASFGTTYNIMPDEYKELTRLRAYPSDPVHDDPQYDELIDQLLYCLFDKNSPLNPDSIASLKIHLNQDPAQIVFTDEMIDSLIDVLERNHSRLKAAAEILRQLGPASHVDGRKLELQDLISQYNAIESESFDLIAKEKKLAKLFTAGTSALAALPGVGIYFGLGISMPWLAAAAAAGPLAALLANQFTPAIAESLVQKIKLPHRLDKMLYRVHKIIT